MCPQSFCRLLGAGFCFDRQVFQRFSCMFQSRLLVVPLQPKGKVRLLKPNRRNRCFACAFPYQVLLKNWLSWLVGAQKQPTIHGVAILHLGCF